MDWKELFGSDDEDEESQPITEFKEIPGLKLVRNCLSHEQQMELTNFLIQKEYFTNDRNQVMLFGNLPFDWLTASITQQYPTLFDDEIIGREPLFDQAILNMYKKGEGIISHVDLLRFEDGILIISLLSSCVMRMRPASLNSASYKKKEYDDSDREIGILLRPGDVLALSKEARYDWEHGIQECLFDCIGDEVIERGVRLSVTLRKVVKDYDSLPTILATKREAI